MNDTDKVCPNTTNIDNLIIYTLSKMSKDKRIPYCLKNGLNFEDYQFRLRKFKTKK